jgi:hypothetical protein
MILGDHVSTSMEFFRLVPVDTSHGDESGLVFIDELLACDNVEAPDYQWQDKDGVSPHPRFYCLYV